MELQRHQLVWLTAGGWRHLLSGATRDPGALECLRHWAGHDLPLVVTCQPPPERPADEMLMVGLAAPLRWQRQRLSLQVRKSAVRCVGAFPEAAAMGPLLPAAARRSWAALTAALAQLGVEAHIYGSHGWQLLSGMDCLREGSDIDLMLAVRSPAHADAVVAFLQQPGFEAPRLDGEIIYPDGSAVAWREWAAWRAGRARQLIVKRRAGAVLVRDLAWAQAA